MNRPLRAPCASPIALDTLVAYWAGDLDASQTDDVEAHVFGCATCTTASERVASVTEGIRALEPFVIGPARLAELRALGRRIDDNFMAPGDRKRVVFSTQEIIVHHLGGLPLADVDRVGVNVFVDGTDQLINEAHSVPFDAEKGEVLIACQRHFEVFPHNVAIEVTAFAGSEKKKVARYVVEHEWALG